MRLLNIPRRGRPREPNNISAVFIMIYFLFGRIIRTYSVPYRHSFDFYFRHGHAQLDQFANIPLFPFFVEEVELRLVVPNKRIIAEWYFPASLLLIFPVRENGVEVHHPDFGQQSYIIDECGD